MNKTKTKEVLYDYYCRACEEEWTSNQVETHCQNCKRQTIVIEVKRPKVIRWTRKTTREPDYDWENEVRNAR
jgi:Zn finger protein HypA/HybF involved in hydrogenase expression